MLVAFGVAQERRNPQTIEPTPAQSQNNVSKILQPQSAQPEQRQAAECVSSAKIVQFGEHERLSPVWLATRLAGRKSPQTASHFA